MGIPKESLSQYIPYMAIQTFATDHPIVQQTPEDYHFEIPSIFSDIFYDNLVGRHS